MVDASRIRLERFSAGANALVVGASGGIGGALADALDAHPRFGRVVRTGRTSAPGMHALDLSDDASIDAFARGLDDSLDALHLVIVCAGLLHDETIGVTPEKRLADLGRAALHRSYDVNAVGPALLAQALASRLPRRAHAVWATLSARVGSIGDNRLGGWYGYRASKAAQNMFTRNLAIELGRRSKQIVVLALHPGTVNTGLSKPFQRSVKPAQLFEVDRATRQLLAVVDGAGRETHHGGFFAWDGAPIPW